MDTLELVCNEKNKIENILAKYITKVFEICQHSLNNTRSQGTHLLMK